MSFMFCAVYQNQQTSWIICLFLALILDFCVLEFFWELLIGCFFSCRKTSKPGLKVAEFLNRAKSMRNLS